MNEDAIKLGRFESLLTVQIEKARQRREDEPTKSPQDEEKSEHDNKEPSGAPAGGSQGCFSLQLGFGKEEKPTSSKNRNLYALSSHGNHDAEVKVTRKDCSNRSINYYHRKRKSQDSTSSFDCDKSGNGRHKIFIAASAEGKKTSQNLIPVFAPHMRDEEDHLMLDMAFNDERIDFPDSLSDGRAETHLYQSRHHCFNNSNPQEAKGLAHIENNNSEDGEHLEIEDRMVDLTLIKGGASVDSRTEGPKPDQVGNIRPHRSTDMLTQFETKLMQAKQHNREKSTNRTTSQTQASCTAERMAHTGSPARAVNCPASTDRGDVDDAGEQEMTTTGEIGRVVTPNDEDRVTLAGDESQTVTPGLNRHTMTPDKDGGETAFGEPRERRTSGQHVQHVQSGERVCAQGTRTAMSEENNLISVIDDKCQIMTPDGKCQLITTVQYRLMISDEGCQMVTTSDSDVESTNVHTTIHQSRRANVAAELDKKNEQESGRKKSNPEKDQEKVKTGCPLRQCATENGEFDYEFDVIERLLIPVRMTFDKAEMSLLEELQQAEKEDSTTDQQQLEYLNLLAAFSNNHLCNTETRIGSDLTQHHCNSHSDKQCLGTHSVTVREVPGENLIMEDFTEFEDELYAASNEVFFDAQPWIDNAGSETAPQVCTKPQDSETRSNVFADVLYSDSDMSDYEDCIGESDEMLELNSDSTVHDKGPETKYAFILATSKAENNQEVEVKDIAVTKPTFKAADTLCEFSDVAANGTRCSFYEDPSLRPSSSDSCLLWCMDEIIAKASIDSADDCDSSIEIPNCSGYYEASSTQMDMISGESGENNAEIVLLNAKEMPIMAEEGLSKNVNASSTESKHKCCSSDGPATVETSEPNTEASTDSTLSMWLQLEEQLVGCPLTLNNNSLPTPGTKPSRRLPGSQPCNFYYDPMDDDSYMVEYSYTRRRNPSHPKGGPVSRLPQINQRSRDMDRSRPQKAGGPTPPRRPSAEAESNVTVTRIKTSGKHPEDCKCLDYDCLRKRGEKLHDHVMQNLDVLKQFASDRQLKRSNFTIKIKEAVGGKAKDLIQNQRSAYPRSEKYSTPVIDNFPPLSQDRRTPDNNVTPGSRTSMKPTYKRHSTGSYSPSNPFPSTSQGMKSFKERTKSAYGRQPSPTTSKAPRPRTCLHARNITPGIEEAWRQRKSSSRSSEASSTNPKAACTYSQYAEAENSGDSVSVKRSLEDTPSASMARDPRLARPDQLVAEALERLFCLRRRDEENSRFANQLGASSTQRPEPSCSSSSRNGPSRQRSLETGGKSSVAERIPSSRTANMDMPEESSGFTLPQNPSTAYFLSVEVPKPKHRGRSSSLSLSRLERKPADSCEKKCIIVDTGKNTVTRELEKRSYNPNSKRTTAFYYSLTHEPKEDCQPVSGAETTNRVFNSNEAIPSVSDTFSAPMSNCGHRDKAPIAATSRTRQTSSSHTRTPYAGNAVGAARISSSLDSSAAKNASSLTFDTAADRGNNAAVVEKSDHRQLCGKEDCIYERQEVKSRSVTTKGPTGSITSVTEDIAEGSALYATYAEGAPSAGGAASGSEDRDRLSAVSHVTEPDHTAPAAVPDLTAEEAERAEYPIPSWSQISAISDRGEAVDLAKALTVESVTSHNARTSTPKQRTKYTASSFSRSPSPTFSLASKISGGFPTPPVRGRAENLPSPRHQVKSYDAKPRSPTSRTASSTPLSPTRTTGSLLRPDLQRLRRVQQLSGTNKKSLSSGVHRPRGQLSDTSHRAPGSASTIQRRSPGTASGIAHKSPVTASSKGQRSLVSSSTTGHTSPGHASYAGRKYAGSASLSEHTSPGNAHSVGNKSPPYIMRRSPRRPSYITQTASTISHRSPGKIGHMPSTASNISAAGHRSPGSASNIGHRSPGSASNSGHRSPGSASNSGHRSSGSASNSGHRSPSIASNSGLRLPGSASNIGHRSPGIASNSGLRLPGSASNSGHRSPGSASNSGHRSPGSASNISHRSPGSASNSGHTASSIGQMAPGNASTVSHKAYSTLNAGQTTSRETSRSNNRVTDFPLSNNSAPSIGRNSDHIITQSVVGGNQGSSTSASGRSRAKRSRSRSRRRRKSPLSKVRLSASPIDEVFSSSQQSQGDQYVVGGRTSPTLTAREIRPSYGSIPRHRSPSGSNRKRRSRSPRHKPSMAKSTTSSTDSALGVSLQNDSAMPVFSPAGASPSNDPLASLSRTSHTSTRGAPGSISFQLDAPRDSILVSTTKSLLTPFKRLKDYLFSTQRRDSVNENTRPGQTSPLVPGLSIPSPPSHVSRLLQGLGSIQAYFFPQTPGFVTPERTPSPPVYQQHKSGSGTSQTSGSSRKTYSIGSKSVTTTDTSAAPSSSYREASPPRSSRAVRREPSPLRSSPGVFIKEADNVVSRYALDGAGKGSGRHTSSHRSVSRESVLSSSSHQSYRHSRWSSTSTVTTRYDGRLQQPTLGRYAGEAFVKLAVVVKALGQIAQLRQDALGRAVVMVVLVLLVSGGYMCGCHCCLKSLTFKSSLDLEKLVENVLVHLHLRHVSLPPL